MKSYIPTINISSLLKLDFNTLASKNILRKIEKACVDIGFFQVTGHGIDIKKINNVCKIGDRFFNSPSANKNKLASKKWNKKNKNLYRGYFPNTVNGKEGLDLGDLQIKPHNIEKYSLDRLDDSLYQHHLNRCLHYSGMKCKELEV